MSTEKKSAATKKDEPDFSALARIQALEEEVAALKASVAAALGISV